MTCEVYENLISGICMDCGERTDSTHVIFEGCEHPHLPGIPCEHPVLFCEDCCPECNYELDDPEFGGVPETAQEKLF